MANGTPRAADGSAPDPGRESAPESAPESALRVYYDGGCPICRREIAGYRQARGADALDWVDVSRDDAPLGEGLTREEAMARMHVRDERGRLIDGAAAFAAIWKRLPATRLLGRIAGSPPALLLLEPAYRVFLKVRPLWRR